MGDIVLFVSREDGALKKLTGIAGECGFGIRTLLESTGTTLSGIRAGEIKVEPYIKRVPEKLEDMNLSQITFKQTQDVSRAALMIYDTI